VDAPAERLACAENVGSNICVSVCCLRWGRTFVDSWLVFPAPLEVRRSARKGVQLFWPTVSSWARGKGTLYIRVAGGHLCSLLTRPLGFFIEINVSLPSSSARRASRLVLSCPCLAPIGERSAVSLAFVRTTHCFASVSGSRSRYRSRTITRLHGISLVLSRRDTRSRPPIYQFTMSSTSTSHARVRVLRHDIWVALQELSKIEVDTSDPQKVEEVMQQIRSLAIQILESPRSQLQAERDEAIRNLDDVQKALEDQKQIALALARLGVPSPTGAEGSSVARPKLAELTDPPKFGGNRKDLRTFIAQLRLKLHGNTQSFPTMQHRLSYAVGRLEGVAFEQILPYIEDNAVNLDDIDALIKILEDAFGDPDRVATATRELRNLRQANREFSLYFADFQRLSAETEWNESAKKDALQNGLCEELKDALTLLIEEEEYSAFVKQLQRLDNKLRARQADKKKGGANSGKSGSAPARSTAPIPKTSSTSGGHPTQTGSGYYGPAPMDLSEGKHISEEEKASRKAEGRCFYCGGVGHIARNCPNRPKKVHGAVAEVHEDCGHTHEETPSNSLVESGKV
jgi:hypothetical protein